MGEMYYVGDHSEIFETIGDKLLTYVDVAGVAATISRSDFLHTETSFVFMARQKTTQHLWSYAAAVLFAIDNKVPFSSIYHQSAEKASIVMPWEVALPFSRN